MSDERESFEAALRADRYDEMTRKVFADWLEENGFDDEAEFQRGWTREWQEAEDYVLAFCERVDLNYDYFLEEARKHLASGDSIECTLDTSNRTTDEGMDVLWAAVTVLLETDPVERQYRGDPFTCGGFCFPRGVSWADSSRNKTAEEGDESDD